MNERNLILPGNPRYQPKEMKDFSVTTILFWSGSGGNRHVRNSRRNRSNSVGRDNDPEPGTERKTTGNSDESS